MLKILIVEDQLFYLAQYRADAGTKVEVLCATSILEAVDLFKENPDISGIIMDACVPGKVPTTIPLTRRFRETFKGPMIAASSDSIYRKHLMKAGCDYESPKGEAVRKLFQILEI